MPSAWDARAAVHRRPLCCTVLPGVSLASLAILVVDLYVPVSARADFPSILTDRRRRYSGSVCSCILSSDIQMYREKGMCRAGA